MLHKISIFLSFICFLSFVHSEGRQPYDPSTVINVYPSLASLNNKGKPMDMDDDYDEDDEDGDDDCDYNKKGSCASASNVHSTWMKKIGEKEPKEGVHFNNVLIGPSGTRGPDYVVGMHDKKFPGYELMLECRFEPVATAPPKHDHKNKEPKKLKPNPKSKFAKSAPETTVPIPHPVPEQHKPSLPPSFKSDTPSKIMQLPEEEKNKVHNWSSLQDMLQLLKKRKH